MSATVSGVDNTRKQDMNRAYHVFLLFNGIIFGHAGSLLPPALFSSCGGGGRSPVVVRGLLIGMASPVAEHRL